MTIIKDSQLPNNILTVLIHDLKPLGVLQFWCHFWVPSTICFNKMHNIFQNGVDDFEIEHKTCLFLIRGAVPPYIQISRPTKKEKKYHKTVKSPSVTQRSVSHQNTCCKKSLKSSPFFSHNYRLRKFFFTLIDRFLRYQSLNSR